MQINCRFPTQRYAPRGLLRNVSCHSAPSLPKNGQLIKSHFYPRSRCSDAAPLGNLTSHLQQVNIPQTVRSAIFNQQNPKKINKRRISKLFIIQVSIKIMPPFLTSPFSYCISTLTDRLSLSAPSSPATSTDATTTTNQ